MSNLAVFLKDLLLASFRKEKIFSFRSLSSAVQRPVLFSPEKRGFREKIIYHGLRHRAKRKRGLYPARGWSGWPKKEKMLAWRKKVCYNESVESQCRATSRSFLHIKFDLFPTNVQHHKVALSVGTERAFNTYMVLFLFVMALKRKRRQ